MKKTILWILVALSAFTATAQRNNEKYAAIQVGFVPPLCTNGSSAIEYTNGVSFNVLAGISNNEMAFTFSGLVNIILNNANGIQFAGLYNYVGNTGNGLIFAGLANNISNDYRGFEFAGILNTTDNLAGMQLAGLLNAASNVRGMQFGGLINISNNLRGAQIAGFTNFAADTRGLQIAGLVNAVSNVQGFQIACLANIAKDVKGFQLGGLGNITSDFKGLQFAGLGNITGNVRGFQFAGLFNKVHDIQGFQFAGLVNKARIVNGVQFAGLVNIAEKSDYPIGLVNIIRTGDMAVGVTYNDTGNILAAFRSGGRVLYGILGVGYNHKMTSYKYVTEGGFGAHINCTRWFRINNELKAATIIGNNTGDFQPFTASYALMPAFRIAGHLELFGGSTITYTNGDNKSVREVTPTNTLWEHTTGNRSQTLHIGYTFGIQYVF